MLIDPVCGKDIISTQNALYRTINNQTVYLCSVTCAELFDANPEKFLTRDKTSFLDASADTFAEDESPVQVDFAIHGLYSTDVPFMKQALECLPGVVGASINGKTGHVAVIYDPANTQVTDLINCVRTAGFLVDKQSLRLKVTGLYCNRCPEIIVRTLLGTSGIFSAALNSATSEVKVEYSPQVSDLNLVRHTIEEAGPYQVYQILDTSEPSLSQKAPPNKNEHLSLLRQWWF